MGRKLIEIINAFLNKLETILVICLLIFATGRILKFDWLSDFLEKFSIVTLVLLVIWLIWYLFFGKREIAFLPKKIKDKIKKMNYDSKEKKGILVFIIILTVAYITCIIQNMKGEIFIGSFPGAKNVVNIGAALTYIFSVLISFMVYFSILPDFDKILTEKFNMTKIEEKLKYYKPADGNLRSYYFSYKVIEDERSSFLALFIIMYYGIRERRWSYRWRNRSSRITYHNIEGEIVFENYSMNTINIIKRELKNLREEYDYLIIKAEIYDEELIIRTKGRSEYTNTTSAKYPVAVLIGMCEVAEKIRRLNE